MTRKFLLSVGIPITRNSYSLILPKYSGENLKVKSFATVLARLFYEKSITKSVSVDILLVSIGEDYKR